MPRPEITVDARGRARKLAGELEGFGETRSFQDDLKIIMGFVERRLEADEQPEPVREEPSGLERAAARQRRSGGPGSRRPGPSRK